MTFKMAMNGSLSPKAILFDIGGVCLQSPMQAIQDYERKHHIPANWINFAIRHASPNGHWQRLERGEIKLNADFFRGFKADLQNIEAWKVFLSNFEGQETKLKHLANPTQLGDPISLKAESAKSNPTPEDRGATPPTSSPQRSEQKPTLSKLAKDTTIGDPVSLESEAVVESGTRNSSSDESQSLSTRPTNKPPIGHDKAPEIDSESLFWAMMTASRHPDPYIFPALQRLTQLKPRPIIAALSNTVIFPPDHPWSKQNVSQKKTNASREELAVANLPSYFDIYIASADVGMRKPSRDIYELALQRINNFASSKGGTPIKANDIVFLDDIGENLKTGRDMGMQTIKVQMGKTWRAVKQLEEILGNSGEAVELMDEKTRRAKM